MLVTQEFMVHLMGQTVAAIGEMIALTIGLWLAASLLLRIAVEVADRFIDRKANIDQPPARS